MIEFDVKHIDLDQIMKSGQCFRWFKVRENSYAFIANGKVFETSCKDSRLIIPAASDSDRKFLSDYFDLQTDYGIIISESEQTDQYLQSAISRFNGVRILKQDLWETIVSFIISQRKSIPAIRSCIKTICENFGEPISENNYSFPSADVISSLSIEDLRKCSVGYRDSYIKAAAEWFIENHTKSITQEMLLEIPGVGKKVSNCIGLFGLHDLSCCPIDVWMQRIIDTRYDGKYPKWMESQYAGVYQQYVFMYERYLSQKLKGATNWK